MAPCRHRNFTEKDHSLKRQRFGRKKRERIDDSFIMGFGIFFYGYSFLLVRSTHEECGEQCDRESKLVGHTHYFSLLPLALIDI